MEPLRERKERLLPKHEMSAAIPGMELACRLVNFGTRFLNDGMEEHYSRWLPLFSEQDFKDLKNRGHTHDQYLAFQEYRSILEQAVEKFAELEGFAGNHEALFEQLW